MKELSDLSKNTVRGAKILDFLRRMDEVFAPQWGLLSSLEDFSEVPQEEVKKMTIRMQATKASYGKIIQFIEKELGYTRKTMDQIPEKVFRARHFRGQRIVEILLFLNNEKELCQNEVEALSAMSQFDFSDLIHYFEVQHNFYALIQEELTFIFAVKGDTPSIRLWFKAFERTPEGFLGKKRKKRMEGL